VAEDVSADEPEWMRLAWQLAGDIRQRRRAAGLSQPRLAARIGYTKQYVSLAERPQRGLPSASLIQAIDDALGADGVLVALHEQADDARKACRPAALPSTMTADATTDTTTGREPGTPSAHPDPREVENAKRRKLITAAAAITFGASLDEPVARILAAADEPQVPTQVRAGDLAHLRSIIETLAAENSRVGASPVRHQALAALRWATALQESSCTPAIRQELAVLTAGLADIAAWIIFDCGRYEPARQLSLFGLQAAGESGDLGMRAWIASGLARQELYRGDSAAGLELTQLAFTAGDALTPNAIADLHTVKALAYARKQDTAECLRCLGAAADSYRPDSVADEPPWLLDFTPARFERNLAFTRYYLLLGGADVGDRAVQRLALIENFSNAFRQYPVDANLNKAIIATRLATLLYQEGEHHTAHQTAEDAITLAGQVRSALLADDLRVLLRTLPPRDSANDYARDLRQRLSLALTEMT
jgi:DNA-binding XRE family transcriptional regulator